MVGQDSSARRTARKTTPRPLEGRGLERSGQTVAETGQSEEGDVSYRNGESSLSSEMKAEAAVPVLASSQLEAFRCLGSMLDGTLVNLLLEYRMLVRRHSACRSRQQGEGKDR